MLPSPTQVWKADSYGFAQMKEDVQEFVEVVKEPSCKEIRTIQAVQDRIFNTLPVEILQTIFQHADLESAISFANVFPEAVPSHVRQRARSVQEMEHPQLIEKLVQKQRIPLLSRIYQPKDDNLFQEFLFRFPSKEVLDWYLSKTNNISLFVNAIMDGTPTQLHLDLVEYLIIKYPQCIKGDELFWLRFLDFIVDHHFVHGIPLVINHMT